MHLVERLVGGVLVVCGGGKFGLDYGGPRSEAAGQWKSGWRRVGMNTHQTLASKNRLPLLRQLQRRDRDLPAFLIPRNFLAHCAAYYLVTEADTDNADAVLGEELLDESDEVVYPGGVFESGVF